MNTEYTPVQGRGFIRPGETKKPCYRVFSGIKKAAPIRNRLSEQLTCCEKIGSVQWDYISQVTKRHNCRITGKTKATCYGGPSTQATRYPQRMSITNNATFAAGGQCDQCAGLLVDCQPLGSMPSLRSLSRQAFLTHELKLPGPATSLICCNNVSSKRMFFFVLPERSNFGFSFFSCIGTYHHYKLKSNGTYHVKNTQPLNTAKPRSGGTLAGLLTTNDSESIEVAMRNHTTHPQGRDLHNLNKPDVKNLLLATASQGYDLYAPAKSGAGIGVLVFNEAHNTRPACFFVPDSHTLSMVGCMGAEQSAPGSSLTGYANPVQSTASEIGVSCGGFINPNEEAANMATVPTLVHSQTAFIWRFIIFGASESQIIHVTAWTEREARNHCPSGCVAVFAARIRQGVRHD